MSISYHRTAYFVSLLALACSPATTLAPVPAAGINAGVGKTWNAVIDILSESNIPVKTLDKSSGYVMAEIAGVGVLEEDKLADCGGFLTSFGATGSMIARYNILVRGDSTASTVKVTAKFTKTGDVPKDCPSKNTFETKFQSDVKARAEAR
jgi:hypothetical protein